MTGIFAGLPWWLAIPAAGAAAVAVAFAVLAFRIRRNAPAVRARWAQAAADGLEAARSPAQAGSPR